MFRVLFHHILPFVSAIFVGVTAFYVVAPVDVPVPDHSKSCRFQGSGSGSGRVDQRFSPADLPAPGTVDVLNVPFQIIAKPKAVYTDAARQNGTEGSVLLKVTLLASGKVGGVSVVHGLPDGLTEQAIAAAQNIKFEPKRVNGVPVSVVQTFEYTFSIY